MGGGQSVANSEARASNPWMSVGDADRLPAVTCSRRRARFTGQAATLNQQLGRRRAPAALGIPRIPEDREEPKRPRLNTNDKQRQSSNVSIAGYHTPGGC